jgi:hypothetical protein
LALYAAGDAFVGIATNGLYVAEIGVESWSPASTQKRTIPLRFIAATMSA